MGKEVIIYSTPTCMYCKMAKEFFSENNISFKEHNVAEDEKARGEMMEKTGQMGVPVIDVGNETIIGFDKERVRTALGIS